MAAISRDHTTASGARGTGLAQLATIGVLALLSLMCRVAMRKEIDVRLRATNLG